MFSLRTFCHVYTDNGNITSIDGVGTLVYGGGTGVSPYEVTGLIPEQGQPGYRQRSVTYNSFDRPASVSEDDFIADFTYDGSGNKVLTHVYEIGTGTHLKRYYVSDRYEYELEPITPTERLYLGGDAYSAPMVLQRTGANGTWTLYDIGRDYLGSITEIVNDSNTSSAYHYRYDPWGKLVNYSRVQPYFLGRGYTGHEHLPWFGLINANARLYDPVLGRFLSPDPYVQDSDFTQNYNRFSYCLNNPLKYTDESGEVVGTALAIAALIGGISNWWANGAEWSWRGLGYYFTGVLAGALGAATGGLISSSLSSICFISGAVSGMVSGGTSGLILGSSNSWLQGSSLCGGLISGLKASFTGSILGGLSGGINSGLTAIKNGGNFWTGEGATYECFGKSDLKITVGENMEYSNEYAREFSDEWFGANVRNVHELHANGDLPNLTQYYKRGDLVYKISEGGKQSQETWGSCVDMGIGNGYDVYLYKAAFTSHERLYLTMGHEYLHAVFSPMSNTIPGKYRGYYQHAAIYDWAQTQAKLWDFNASYYQAMYNKYSAYIPSNPYSYIKAGFYILPVNPF